MSDRLKYVGLALFAVVDVVLIAYLFLGPPGAGSGDRTEEASAAEATPPTESDQSENGRSEDTGPGEAAGETAGADGPVTYVEGGETLFRFSRGRCTGSGAAGGEAGDTTPEARLERAAADTATTFETVALPENGQQTPLVTVLAVEATSADDVLAVGTGQDCTPRQFRTSDGGQTWQSTDQRPDWFIGPAGDEVIGRTGAADPGCEILTVAGLDPASVKILCDDGTVRGTSDGGEEWVVLGELSGARDIVFEGLSTGLALARTDDCAAQAFSTTDAGDVWQEQACVTEDGKDPQLAGLPDDAYAVVDGEVWTSGDTGATWTPAE